MGGSLPGEDYMWECTLPSWAVWLKEAATCYNVEKRWSSDDLYFSHCCNRGGVAITPDGISCIPGRVFQGTASRWLHIVAGLYTALFCFRKKYAKTYSVSLRGKKLFIRYIHIRPIIY